MLESIFSFLFSLRWDGVSEGWVGGKRTRLSFLHECWEVNERDCLFFILVLIGMLESFLFYSVFGVMALVRVGWEVKERDCLFFILVLMGNA